MSEPGTVVWFGRAQRFVPRFRPTTMHLVLTAATAALLCAACAGCSGGTGDDAARHVGTYEATGEGGDAALLEGTVVIQDGCFVVKTSTGNRIVPYFPEDEIEWSDGNLRYDGSTYRPGDSIALGGGGGADASSHVPAACRSLVNHLSEFTVAQSD